MELLIIAVVVTVINIALKNAKTTSDAQPLRHDPKRPYAVGYKDDRGRSRSFSHRYPSLEVARKAAKRVHRYVRFRTAVVDTRTQIVVWDSDEGT